MTRSLNCEQFLAFTLMGSPGCGKGTQSSYIQNRLGYKHISTGDLCREAIKRNDPAAETLKELMQKGELVPDDMMMLFLVDKLHQICDTEDKPKGVILDGFPRNTNQARLMDEITQVLRLQFLGIIYIYVPDDIVYERMLKRGKSGEQERVDDQDKTIRERIRVFHEKTLPLVNYFSEQNKLSKVDGIGTPDEVFQRIEPIIRGWENTKFQD